MKAKSIPWLRLVYMEAVYLLFTDCCKRLKTGQELTALHAELEDILKSPLCWEMCMTVLCSPTALPDADRVYHHFVAAKMVHLLTAQDWTQLPRSLQDKIKKVLLYI